MAVLIRRAEADDMDELVSMDFRNFGVGLLPKDEPLPDGLLEPERFLVAVDDDQMVGAAGSFKMDLTLPGFATVPMSGVTWVSVMASHRRRGILRSMMEGLDDMAVELDEPSLGLTASEGGIYERFGYGVATPRRVIEIDRRRTGIDPTLTPDQVKLVDATDHIDEFMAIYNRYRLTQIGEVSRTEPLMREQAIHPKKPNYAAIHPDGYAVWSVEPRWNGGHPAHELWIKDLIAVTPEAHLALWNLILSLDLVGLISSYNAVGIDDTLPSLLTDPRALRTTDLNDGLWVKVTDTVRCFGARTYRADDRLVVGVVEQQRLSADLGNNPKEIVAISSDDVTPTDEEPDLLTTRAGLGPLLLGNPASVLADNRMVAADGRILDRADMLFGTGRRAYLKTGF